MKVVIAIAAAATVVGCAGAPVGWGGTDEVVFASENTIKLQWDNTTTNEDAVRAKAVAHCKGRDVEVVDASSDAYTFGLVRSRTWRCIDPARAAGNR